MVQYETDLTDGKAHTGCILYMSILAREDISAYSLEEGTWHTVHFHLKIWPTFQVASVLILPSLLQDGETFATQIQWCHVMQPPPQFPKLINYA